jgi:hypothetical protein
VFPRRALLVWKKDEPRSTADHFSGVEQQDDLWVHLGYHRDTAGGNRASSSGKGTGRTLEEQTGRTLKKDQNQEEQGNAKKQVVFGVVPLLGCGEKPSNLRRREGKDFCLTSSWLGNGRCSSLDLRKEPGKVAGHPSSPWTLGVAPGTLEGTGVACTRFQKRRCVG